VGVHCKAGACGKCVCACMYALAYGYAPRAGRCLTTPAVLLLHRSWANRNVHWRVRDEALQVLCPGGHCLVPYLSPRLHCRASATLLGGASATTGALLYCLWRGGLFTLWAPVAQENEARFWKMGTEVRRRFTMPAGRPPPALVLEPTVETTRKSPSRVHLDDHISSPTNGGARAGAGIGVGAGAGGGDVGV